MTTLTGRGSETNTAKHGRPARYGGLFAAVVAAALIGYAGVAKAASPRALIEADAGQPDAEPAAPQPEERVALVIGNSRYRHIASLHGANDGESVGAALGRLGFTVTKLQDASYADMVWGLQEFAQAAQTAQTAVVFYAGHGHWANGRNFLGPVDVREDAPDPDALNLFVTQENFGWIPVEWLMRSVAGASNLRLVVLDTHVEFPLGPVGETVVAQAAAVGTYSMDVDPRDVGGDRNSPYTNALLKYLEEPGLEVGLLFRKVRAEVLRKTDGKQEPVVYGLPGQGVYLHPMPDQHGSSPLD